MRHIYTNDQILRASITKQPKAADTYRSEEPWLLLHTTGRVDHFATYREVRDEAFKSYPGSHVET